MMVNDIKTCNQEIIKGLEERITNMEKQQKPTEILVKGHWHKRSSTKLGVLTNLINY
jgi:hypothetical protein